MESNGNGLDLIARLAAECRRREEAGEQGEPTCKRCGAWAMHDDVPYCRDCAPSACVLARAQVSTMAVGEWAQVSAMHDDSPILGDRRVLQCDACMSTKHLHWYQKRNGRLYTVCEPCGGHDLERGCALFDEARLPGNAHACSFENFEDRNPAINAVREEIEEQAKTLRPGAAGMLLQGGTGAGKTHLLVATARLLTLRRRIAVRFVDWSQLIAALYDGLDDRRSLTSLMTTLQSVPVLIIDEIAQGKASDFRVEALDRLLTKRYQNPRTTTFAATNEETGALEAYLGKKLWSRMSTLMRVRRAVATDYRREAGAR